MPYDRRDILRSVGVAGAGTVLTFGTATASEDECVDVVDTTSFSEVCLEAQGNQTPACSPPAPIVSQGAAFGDGNPGYVTQAYQLPDGAYESTDFETRILAATVQGSPSGGNMCSLVQQRSDGGWQTVSEVVQPGQPHEHEIYGGFDGTIEPGVEYRVKVQAINVPFTEATAELEFQAHDEDC